MDNKKKIDNNYIKGLQSSDFQTVKSALANIRPTLGAIYVPNIIEILSESSDSEINEILAQYLYDLKVEEVKTHLIDSIKNPKHKNILAILVSACWQNGISFKDYYALFTDVFIKEDFTVSIEAYSVIESILDDLNKEEKDFIILKLKSSISSMDDNKRSFTSSLVKMINEHTTIL